MSKPRLNEVASASVHDMSSMQRLTSKETNSSHHKYTGKTRTDIIRSILVETLEVPLMAEHVEVTDLSCLELQYRLLGVKRFWYRSVKQEKFGHRWESHIYEVAVPPTHKLLLHQLRSSSWHSMRNIPEIDQCVRLKSLGLFETEKAAIHAYDTAFKARERNNPIAFTYNKDPLPNQYVTWFQVTIVSDVFARKDQMQRLEIVYEVCWDLGV